MRIALIIVLDIILVGVCAYMRYSGLIPYTLYLMLSLILGVVTYALIKQQLNKPPQC